MNISTDGESEILTGLTFINVTRKKSKKPKKKKTNINKTREHLLILINNELITAAAYVSLVDETLTYVIQVLGAL